jgi:carbonic anhydrase
VKRIVAAHEAVAKHKIQIHGWVYDINNGRIKPVEGVEEI